MENQLLSMLQVSEILPISHNTAIRYARNGVYPTVRSGRRYLITPNDLVLYIHKQIKVYEEAIDDVTRLRG